MKNRVVAFTCVFAAIVTLAVGCGRNTEPLPDTGLPAESSMEQMENGEQGNAVVQNNGNIESHMDTITLDSEVMELESGLKAVQYDGAYGFEEYPAQGGASSDAHVVAFLMGYLAAETSLELI